MPTPIDVAPPETATTTTVTVDYIVASDADLERPYRVIIENDDVTPMEFVVLVLLSIFDLDIERAEAVMLEAHHQGHAYVISLPFEDAQQRVYQAHSIARASGYPLSFYLEPDH